MWEGMLSAYPIYRPIYFIQTKKRNIGCDWEPHENTFEVQWTKDLGLNKSPREWYVVKMKTNSSAWRWSPLLFKPPVCFQIVFFRQCQILWGWNVFQMLSTFSCNMFFLSWKPPQGNTLKVKGLVYVAAELLLKTHTLLKFEFTGLRHLNCRRASIIALKLKWHSCKQVLPLRHVSFKQSSRVEVAQLQGVGGCSCSQPESPVNSAVSCLPCSCLHHSFHHCFHH